MKPQPKYGWHGVKGFCVGARVRLYHTEVYGELLEDVTGQRGWRSDITIWKVRWDKHNPCGDYGAASESDLELV